MDSDNTANTVMDESLQHALANARNTLSQAQDTNRKTERRIYELLNEKKYTSSTSNTRKRQDKAATVAGQKGK